MNDVERIEDFKLAGKTDPHTKPSGKPKQQDNSKTKVHFSETTAYKYMTGQREPITIRIDRGLYARFKPLAKRVYGSVCHAVEIYIITLIEAVENGVHFSNTNKPINIEKIVIERNLRSRRKLEIEEETEVIERVALPRCDFCHKPLVIAQFKHLKSDLVKKACDFHARVLRERSDWVEVASDE